MKKNAFKKAVSFGTRTQFMFPLLIVLLISGLNLSAQQSHTLTSQDPTGGVKTDDAVFYQQFDNLIGQSNYVSRNAAINILENNFNEIESAFANQPLSQVEKTELVISLEFRKFLYSDLKNGKTVRAAFDDNLPQFFTAYNKYDASNLGINAQNLFQKSLSLLSL
jgi:hypothetical protein